jgi:hypothetical protein
LIHRAEFVVYKKQEIRQEVTEMEKSRINAPDPRQQNLEEELSFDESVCSAEFSEGCTLPLREQLDQP